MTQNHPKKKNDCVRKTYTCLRKILQSIRNDNTVPSQFLINGYSASETAHEYLKYTTKG